VYQIEKITEKPALSLAELELSTPGLRTGHYLCFFGMHLLPHTIFDFLGDAIASNGNATGEIQLTPSLNALAEREKYLALEVKGSRYDTGAKYGMLQAQIALAMAGRDCEEVLTTIVELLAAAKQTRGGAADA